MFIFKDFKTTHTSSKYNYFHICIFLVSFSQVSVKGLLITWLSPNSERCKGQFYGPGLLNFRGWTMPCHTLPICSHSPWQTSAHRNHLSRVTLKWRLPSHAPGTQMDKSVGNPRIYLLMGSPLTMMWKVVYRIWTKPTKKLTQEFLHFSLHV